MIQVFIGLSLGIIVAVAITIAILAKAMVKCGHHVYVGARKLDQ